MIEMLVGSGIALAGVLLGAAIATSGKEKKNDQD